MRQVNLTKLPSATGKKELLKHLKNQKLVKEEAIWAKCYECMGYYADGRKDCKIYNCPLYTWMPYKTKES